MKNTKWWLVGILAMALVLGMAVIGCDNGGGGGDDDGDAENDVGDIFKGTWTNEEMELKIVAEDNKFTQYSIVTVEEEEVGEGDPVLVETDKWEMPVLRGTYTTSGNAVTATVTDANTREEKEEPDVWVSYADLPPEAKEDIPQAITGTVSGNTFTTMGFSFTKQ
jgi:hypothetical protein